MAVAVARRTTAVAVALSFGEELDPLLEPGPGAVGVLVLLLEGASALGAVGGEPPGAGGDMLGGVGAGPPGPGEREGVLGGVGAGPPGPGAGEDCSGAVGAAGEGAGLLGAGEGLLGAVGAGLPAAGAGGGAGLEEGAAEAATLMASFCPKPQWPLTPQM